MKGGTQTHTTFDLGVKLQTPAVTRGPVLFPTAARSDKRLFFLVNSKSYPAAERMRQLSS